MLIVEEYEKCNSCNVIFEIIFENLFSISFVYESRITLSANGATFYTIYFQTDRRGVRIEVLRSLITR